MIRFEYPRAFEQRLHLALSRLFRAAKFVRSPRTPTSHNTAQWPSLSYPWKGPCACPRRTAAAGASAGPLLGRAAGAALTRFPQVQLPHVTDSYLHVAPCPTRSPQVRYGGPVAARLSTGWARSTPAVLTNGCRKWRRLWAHASRTQYTRPDTQRRRSTVSRKLCTSTTIAASFCDEALCVTVWHMSHHGSSWMDAVWMVAAPSSPFACMCHHDGSCLITWRMDAIQTTVNMTCLCDAARARQYGMFCTRALRRRLKL